MKINRKNGLRKMQVTDVIIPLLKGDWYHRVSPVKEKPHVLRGDIYFPDYSADSSLCGFIFSMILAFISSATSLFCAR